MSALSPEEIEKMRALVAEHDATNGKAVNEFDLNNPPQKPYRHQEFPKMVYLHEERKHKVVKNATELEAHLKQGWETEPFPVEVEAPALSAAEQKEVERLDKEARKPKATK